MFNLAFSRGLLVKLHYTLHKYNVSLCGREMLCYFVSFLFMRINCKADPTKYAV